MVLDDKVTRYTFTIAIPTYNRCEYLNNNLKRVIPQVLKHRNEVKLLISDNCSTDATRSVVESFIHDYPDIIQYNCNIENKGYLYNFKKCVDLSNSEFICLLGDDDEVAIGYIDTVLNILKNNRDIGLLHYDFYFCNPQNRQLVNFYSRRKFRQMLDIYDDSRDFLLEFLNGPSFMSSVIFKKEIWYKGVGLFEDNCFGYEWLMNIYAGLPGYKCAFYSFPIVMQYNSGINAYSQWWPKYSIIGMSRVFENLEKLYPGIYAMWQKVQKHNPRVYDAIIKIGFYKHLYIGMNSIFIHYLYSCLQRGLCILVFISPRFMSQYLYLPLCKIYALLLKKLY